MISPSSPAPHPSDSLASREALQLVEAAVDLLDQGELPEAIATLRQVLALAPSCADGWLELGNAHMHGDDPGEAIDAYARAIALDSTLNEAHANLALALRQQGRPIEAIAAYRAAIALDPADAEALQDLGHLLQERECWAEALEAFLQAQALAPSAPLHARIADALLRLEDPGGAADHLRQALSLWTPADGEDLRADLLARRAVALHRQGRLDEAIDGYSQALKQRPHLAALNRYRDTALEQLKGAIHQLRQALPTAEAHERPALLGKLGVALQQAGCLEEAIAIYGQALVLEPDRDDLRLLQQAARAQRQDPSVLYQLALRLNLLAFSEEEARVLEQAAALAPDRQPIQQELALSLLRLERFAEGWPLYAWRGEPFSRSASLPRWRSGMACNRLLLLPEQGLGDQIMFASLLPDAVAIAPQHTLIVDPRLRPLLARSFPHLQVVARGQSLNTAMCQAQLALGSLGEPLRPSKDHFLASRRAYLVADPAKTQALRRLHHPSAGSATGQLLVGLSWSSVSTANGFMKSIPLETLAGALAIPGLRLLSLQYGDTRAERDALHQATGLEVHADPQIDTFNDIDDLAALIAACDLVVSVSNTTAHLAGALGQRTWLLIDSRLDWRWGLDEPDALWYPNTRLFRQHAAGDWAAPLEAVRAELGALRKQESRNPSPRPEPLSPPASRWVF